MDYIYQDKYVYFKKEGNGSPIILLHGWGVDSSCFDDLMDSLKEKYQVFAIDLPGFGKSVEPSDYYVLEDYVGLVEQFVNDKKLANPIILGHSFGGRIAIRYASRHRVSKLILVDSAGMKPKNYVKVKLKIMIYKLKKKNDGKNKSNETKRFYALKDISFEIPQGEVVGILGTNGSGKSTLSLILAGISEIDEGTMHINGEQSLVAINTGLNKQLTGLENINVKGALLGCLKSRFKILLMGSSNLQNLVIFYINR